MNLTKNGEKAVAAIVGLLKVGEPEVVITKQIAELGGVSSKDINQAKRLLESIGSLETTMYRNPKKGITTLTYLLKDQPETVVSKIAQLPHTSYAQWLATEGGEKYRIERGLVKPFIGKVENGLVSPFGAAAPTVLIVDVPLAPEVEERPEPIKDLKALAPLRKSESRAYVEATRQYLARWDVAKSHARSLFDAGLIDDVSTFLASLKVERRQDMEAVAQVIPYIDELERTISNMEKASETYRVRASQLDVAEITIRKLREQNSRLLARIAENGASSDARD